MTLFDSAHHYSFFLHVKWLWKIGSPMDERMYLHLSALFPLTDTYLKALKANSTCTTAWKVFKFDAGLRAKDNFPINTNLLLMFISADGFTEDPELDCSSVCKNYLETIYSFSTHLFTQFQRHSAVDVIGFLWRRQVLELSNFIMYQRMGNEGASDKPEKEKVEKATQENEKPHEWKPEEKRGSQTLDHGKSVLSVLDGKRTTAVAPVLFFVFFSKINSNSHEDYNAPLTTIFVYSITQWVS